ncbi:uroporphyrinogen-III synthase [Thermomonas fusca]|uniref:Uroporphyrinogen-III synthase n=1 Tax=Thermomonas fusca TaxID=215690 RepID=A0A5R9PHR4_9GAMM|nr:uroporphyrinogen-III synthase [Thermomonas fusca]TLX22533.1 uroporphyrinogen-III synthase [Thermomonas fusca]
MSRLADQALPLQHWTVLSLRPRGQHAGLRAAATRSGARLLALSPIAIDILDDSDARQSLAAALAADILLFTSPNAARAAAALAPLRPRRGQHWLAVGAGTRRALARSGIDAVAPARMDSEGLLGLPQLVDVRDKRVGLVTAPGGRGVLAPSLAARGATVLRANVYARRAVALSSARRAALEAVLRDPERVLLALSSGEALDALLAQLPARGLGKVAVVAASARLGEAARAAGFTRIALASDARPAALLRAAADAFARHD